MTCERAEAILGRLALSDNVYSGYCERVESFLVEVARFDPFYLPVKKPRLLKSKLFRRKFLVANTICETDGLIFDSLNAVAMMSTDVAGFASPPIVLTAKRQQGAERFYQSVLEHEFVHICQMLLGLLPTFESGSGGATRFLEARTKAEFEAYYLQHCHWPDLHSSSEIRGMAVDEFCCFVAYFHSLEDTLESLLGVVGNLPDIEDFLVTTPGRLYNLLSPLGFSDATCQFYHDVFPGHVEAALGVITDRSRAHLLEQNVNFLRAWLLKQAPPAGAS